jgi:hypothetical protein
MNEKVAHVLAAKQTRRHKCHWPGCPRQVPPAMWGCKEHWMKLPQSLRTEVWRTYRPLQEDDMHPSLEYVEVMKKIQQWIRVNQQKSVPPEQHL